MSRKYRNRKSRKSKPRKSKPQHNRQPRKQQPREFRTQRHRKNRAIPRHDLIEKKKPPVPSFPTQQQDSSERWDYHILRLQSLSVF